MGRGFIESMTKVINPAELSIPLKASKGEKMQLDPQKMQCKKMQKKKVKLPKKFPCKPSCCIKKKKKKKNPPAPSAPV